MKTVIIVLIILALFVGLSMWGEHFVSTSSARLSEKIEIMQKEVQENNIDTALELISAFNNEWQKIFSSWEAVISHEELEEIDISLARLKSYLQSQDLSSAKAELAVLHHLIKHLPDKTKLRFGTLF